jgi:hypothetical protein
VHNFFARRAPVIAPLLVRFSLFLVVSCVRYFSFLLAFGTKRPRIAADFLRHDTD